ncbi:MAG: hypothetical protein FJW40_15715 [Acidobacteria bacterium]|nr:hypothetical protein [Acidobacteriota bacterium]
MTNSELNQELTSLLGLTLPPVGLAFVDGAPGGLTVFDGVAPSACSFWTRAQSGVFYAPAAAHHNCPIGAMTMGFQLPADVMSMLQDVVGMMARCEYIDPAEAGRLIGVSKQKTGIVYGPLGALPVAPDLAVLWLTPRQAMLAGEATGACRWNGDNAPAVWGRPGCAILPIAHEMDRAMLSFGCAGMRTFTAIPDDRILVAVPGRGLAKFAGQVRKAVEANAVMQSFYDSRLHP